MAKKSENMITELKFLHDYCVFQAEREEEHCGDCTNEPQTCLKCMWEGYVEDIETVTEKFAELEETEAGVFEMCDFMGDLKRENTRLKAVVERIVGMCGDVDRCSCGRPTGIPALKACAKSASQACVEGDK